jgi:CheY-like chemotaxis protein
VPEALAWFAGSSGGRQALVAMPTLAAATNLAGMLAAHELDAQATNRGRDAVDMARDMADLETIFVDVDILAPGIRQVLYELRLSPVTRNIPVALLAADGRLDAAERLAAEHDRVIAVPRPHSDEVLSRYIARLQNLAGSDPVPPDERAAQAADARAWLDQLATTRPFYTIRRAVPMARRGHAEAAANLATPSRGHATQP